MYEEFYDPTIMAFNSNPHIKYGPRSLNDIKDMTDEELETSHDWVQWVFPLLVPSACVPNTPVLRDVDVCYLRLVYATPDMGYELFKAQARAFEFFDTWPWYRYPHNFLRITRMITHFRLFDQNEAALNIFEGAINRMLQDGVIQTLPPKTYEFWWNALQTEVIALP